MLIFLAALAAALTAFFIWQDNDIVVTHIEYKSKKVPFEFGGLKILHVSDLHNKWFGKDQERLLRAAAEYRPDIIVITGDIIDSRRKGSGAALAFVSSAVGIAPVCYVSGNHEWSCGQYGVLSERLKRAGVRILDNNHITLTRGNGRLELLGVKDVKFSGEASFARTLKKLAGGTKGFSILLSHHPEMITQYKKCGFDLVFAGHAHGGQIRLPFIGGLFAPGQGVFPKYTSGLYKEGNTSMVVSRGLGNSMFPLRVFNRPNLVVVTLRAA